MAQSTQHPAPSTQHLQKAGPGKRPAASGGQGTVQIAQLTTACLSNIVNLKSLTLNIRVINSTLQTSTPTHQGNTYSTASLSKSENCVKQTSLQPELQENETSSGEQHSKFMLERALKMIQILCFQ